MTNDNEIHIHANFCQSNSWTHVKDSLDFRSFPCLVAKGFVGKCFSDQPFRNSIIGSDNKLFIRKLYSRNASVNKKDHYTSKYSLPTTYSEKIERIICFT